MEFELFFRYLPYTISNQTWFNNAEYINWLNNNPNIMYEFASPLVYTLPGKRQ